MPWCTHIPYLTPVLLVLCVVCFQHAHLQTEVAEKTPPQTPEGGGMSDAQSSKGKCARNTVAKIHSNVCRAARGEKIHHGHARTELCTFKLRR